MTLPTFTLNIDGDLVLLFDTGRGRSITNGAEDVIKELARLLGDDLITKRIIYRDTAGSWDGLAHRADTFLGFVHIGLKDRNAAMMQARAITDWPH